MASDRTAHVVLFKESGKYYTQEEWRIPEGAIGPYDMAGSPDAHTFGGPVLVETQPPWGYPQLLTPARIAQVQVANGEAKLRAVREESCPECVAGKHENCAGFAYDAADDEVPCACQIFTHQEEEEGATPAPG